MSASTQVEKKIFSLASGVFFYLFANVIHNLPGYIKTSHDFPEGDNQFFFFFFYRREPGDECLKSERIQYGHYVFVIHFFHKETSVRKFRK